MQISHLLSADLPLFRISTDFAFFDKILKNVLNLILLNLVRIIGWLVMRMTLEMLILDHCSFSITSYIAFAFTSTILDITLWNLQHLRKVLIHHK